MTKVHLEGSASHVACGRAVSPYTRQTTVATVVTCWRCLSIATGTPVAEMRKARAAFASLLGASSPPMKPAPKRGRPRRDLTKLAALDDATPPEGAPLPRLPKPDDPQD